MVGRRVLVVMAFALVALVGCDAMKGGTLVADNSTIASASPSATASATAASVTTASTSSPVASPSASPRLSPSPSPSESPSPSPTASPTAQATQERTQEPTARATAQPTVARTAAPTQTASPSPTATPTATPTPTASPVPSRTPCGQIAQPSTANPPLAPNTTIGVYGKVTDQCTGAPVANVCVTLGQPGAICWARTDANGNFAIDGAGTVSPNPNTQWQLYFVMPGYPVQPTDRFTMPGGVIRKDWALRL